MSTPTVADTDAARPTCTCDTIAEPGFPHRPWCATEHQHPGPDCPGLCEPPDGPDAAAYPLELWDADPACAHKTTDGSGGGVRCVTCPGWYCA